MQQEQQQQTQTSSQQVNLNQPTAELKNKDIKYRERYKESLAELEQTKIRAEKAEKQIDEIKNSAAQERKIIEQRYIDAKIESAAIAAGLNDPDLVKLIDMSGLKLVDGKLEGLKEAIDEFKAKKPAYFGEAKKISSSTNASTAEASTKPTNAHDLERKDFFAKFGITPK